ncbi:OapC/ArvC family zinc-ribbon domain-containing protein [Halostagnicola kamekurae]|uniref:Zn-ribbon containing protein n=1 Tax=Halostagnicola kamekurae TaxID=619731 RepID=A0A1I6P4R7_9EURY|nr:Zn-ribbon containing protein [Halostagnicola kamekurae]SFS35214.1 hypothetical protein SAMN04488556_0325 [Halostagnicola kamekurae]
MPHQCTNCGRTFPDGSKEMLSGCPDCGGNKFQFAPASTGTGDPAGSSQGESASTAPDDSRTPPERPTGESADSVAARAAESVRDFVSSRSDTPNAENPNPQSGETAESGVAEQSTTEAEVSSKSDAADVARTHRSDEPSQNEKTDQAEKTDEAITSTSETTKNASTDEPIQNTASGWTTASESDDIPSSSGEFPEWPDSARPPEDRSTAVADDGETTSSEASSRATSPGSETTSSKTSSTAGSQQSSSMGSQQNSTAAVEEGSTAPPQDTSKAASRDDIATSQSGTATSQGGTAATRDDTTSSTTRTEAESERADADPVENEDIAQASARSDVVGSDELPDSSDEIEEATAPDHGRVVSEPTGDQPSLEELRAELNEQFESIKILKPGQYELNLMELYNREEYIISLQEDGRYVIDVPDSWRDGTDE